MIDLLWQCILLKCYYLLKFPSPHKFMSVYKSIITFLWLLLIYLLSEFTVIECSSLSGFLQFIHYLRSVFWIRQRQNLILLIKLIYEVFSVISFHFIVIYLNISIIFSFVILIISLLCVCVYVYASCETFLLEIGKLIIKIVVILLFFVCKIKLINQLEAMWE